MWLPFTAAAFSVLVGSIGPPSCVLSAPVMGWTADWPPGLMASGLSLCSLHFRFCGCDGCVFSGPHRIRGSYGTRTLRRRGSAVRTADWPPVFYGFGLSLFSPRFRILWFQGLLFWLWLDTLSLFLASYSQRESNSGRHCRTLCFSRGSFCFTPRVL